MLVIWKIGCYNISIHKRGDGFVKRVFFIADTHFGSDEIRRYENRPFATVQEMDEQMILRWNSAVSDADEVFVLGDFGAEDRVSRILERLRGRKYLVKGNHDIHTNEYYRGAGFSEVYDMPILYKGFWLLSHDALYVNRNMPYANLFGHVHNNPIVKDYSSQHFCVSAERIAYTPIAFDEIVRIVKEDCENE